MNFASLVSHIGAIQYTLQAQAAHSVNLALTSRNWLMGCYIVEFEQHGEDRAVYGEQFLKNLEKKLNTKGLNERRFWEFRCLYLVYPQLREEVLGYVMSGSGIRWLPTAELQMVSDIANNNWKLATEKLFSRLSSTHLNTISAIDNPIKRAFYKWKRFR